MVFNYVGRYAITHDPLVKRDIYIFIYLFINYINDSFEGFSLKITHTEYINTVDILLTINRNRLNIAFFYLLIESIANQNKS